MKNKKVVLATVGILLAPTILDCQQVLAEENAIETSQQAGDSAVIGEPEVDFQMPEVDVSLPEVEEAIELPLDLPVIESEIQTESVLPEAIEESTLVPFAAPVLDIQLISPIVTLKVGDTFNPADYATATKDGEVVPYDDDLFVAIVNEVDTTKAGNYLVVYRLVDPISGEYIDQEMTVSVQNVVLDIQLKQEQVNLKVGDTFDPAEYATATKNGEIVPYDGNLFIAIVNEVDTTKAGDYQVIYRVLEPNSGVSFDKEMLVSVTASVLDIQLKQEQVNLKVGDTFDPAEYATATKDGEIVPYDGDLFVAIVNEVDTTKVGDYKVVYRVIDSNSGAFFDKEMTVSVKNSVLDIQLKQEQVDLKVGDIFDPALYATATKDGETVPYDGNLFVAIANEVDTAKAGNYQVVYRVIDPVSGEFFDKEMIVIVSDSEDLEAVIYAENQTMYVGETLTNEIIMSWATFENIDEFDRYGFEVLGEPIKVTALGSTLVEPGVHRISYYAENDTERIATTITLTVLDTKPDDNDDKPATPLVNDPKVPITGQPTAVKEISGQSTKQLPETGMRESSMMLTSIGMVLIASVYFMKKRKEDEFNLY